MEPRKKLDFNEKYSSLINNRNLKDYSCFTGEKTLNSPEKFNIIIKMALTLINKEKLVKKSKNDKTLLS